MRPLNKEHLGDARTQRFLYAVKPQNTVHLVDIMTLIIMTVCMEQNTRCVFYSEDSSNIQRFVYTVKSLNTEHLVDKRTKMSIQ